MLAYRCTRLQPIRGFGFARVRNHLVVSMPLSPLRRHLSLVLRAFCSTQMRLSFEAPRRLRPWWSPSSVWIATVSNREKKLPLGSAGTVPHRRIHRRLPRSRANSSHSMLLRSWMRLLGWFCLLFATSRPSGLWNVGGWCVSASNTHQTSHDGTVETKDDVSIQNPREKDGQDGNKHFGRDIEVSMYAPWPRVHLERSDPQITRQNAEGKLSLDAREADASEAMNGNTSGDGRSSSIQNMRKLKEKLRTHAPEWEARRKDAEVDRKQAGETAEHACCWLRHGEEVYLHPDQYQPYKKRSGERTREQPDGFQAHKDNLEHTVYSMDPLWDIWMDLDESDEEKFLARQKDASQAPRQGVKETSSARSIELPDVVRLHAAFGSPCFHAFHQKLLPAHRNGSITYLMRPHHGLQGQNSDGIDTSCDIPRQDTMMEGQNDRTWLFGFGVELALKNTEYQAKNDEGGLEQIQDGVEGPGELLHEANSGVDHPGAGLLEQVLRLGASNMNKDVPSPQALDLAGLKIAAMVTNSSEPLEALETITQNLPFVVRGLELFPAKRSVQKQVEAIRSTFGDGGQFLLINEQAYPLDNLDVYGLVQFIADELDFVNSVKESGLPEELMYKAISLGQEEIDEVLVEPRSEHLFLVNDLERDDRYKGWSRSLSSLLSFVMPGQFQPIRRNTCLVVFSVDPASLEGAEILTSMSTFLRRLIPVQFGFYLVVPDHLRILQQASSSGFESERSWESLTLSDQISRAFHHIQESKGGKSAFEFVIAVARFIMKNGVKDTLYWSEIEPLFLKQWTEQRLNAATNSDTTADAKALLALKRGAGAHAAFAMTTQAFHKGLSQDLPFAVVNGRVLPKLYQLQYALSLCLQMQQNLLEAVYTGEVGEKDDVLEWIFRNSVPKYNKDIMEEVESGNNNNDIVINKRSCLHQLIPSTDYLHFPGSEEVIKLVTQLVVVDFTSEKGVYLASQTLDWILQSSSQSSRIAFLPSPSDENHITLLQRIVMILQAAPSRRAKVAPFLARIFSDEELLAALGQIDVDMHTSDQLYSLADSSGLNTNYLRSALSEHGAFSKTKSMEMQHNLSQCISKVLGLQSGVNAVITNSKSYPLSDSRLPFTSSDLNLMFIQAKMKIGGLDSLLSEVLEHPELFKEQEKVYTADELSDLAWRLSYSLSNRPAPRQKIEKGKILEALSMVDEHVKLLNTTISVNGTHDLEILAMVDPFSPKARKLTTILRFLKGQLNVTLKIVLNPSSSPSLSHLSSFYRYHLPQAELEQDTIESVRFTGMPVDKVLTMNVDVPENWLVAPVKADHDLDNILLQELEEGKTLHASFELDSMLVTGSCIDRSAKTQKDLTPRGVQLHLGNATRAHVTDTLVMSNLGYFQLKSSPGHWTLSLAPGRSRELYTVPVTEEDALNLPTLPDTFEKQILVKDFASSHMRFYVQKRPGKEGEDVLDDKEAGSLSYLEKISRLVRPSKKEDERIHVFSIASGHLYERLLKIMILSVLRTTHTPVKFWFIRNYFSPSFAAYMPYMAEDYGFEFEFITYKWPSWLHKQTEKQRIIWAYKILFLDVIFPLSLQRVIFVDADQVVRSDLKELMDMDLHGAPYAYTPFCDNNKEMDGYRFWKQGFWRDHLQGKPYHISALYVVDLKRFRETAAGDQLRVVYDQLSKDPNSLSNLDQDLPNYVQHQVPIFSLPQQWLWCESWCGNETKAAAKTIDLCNNPMTKEPKLAAARRIVREWPAYDQEVRHHTSFVTNLIHNGVLPGAERQTWNYTAEHISLQGTVEHFEL